MTPAAELPRSSYAGAGWASQNMFTLSAQIGREASCRMQRVLTAPELLVTQLCHVTTAIVQKHRPQSLSLGLVFSI